MKFKTEFTEQEINVVMNGLGKLPAELSFQLIVRLTNEFNEFNKELKKPIPEKIKEVVKKDK